MKKGFLTILKTLLPLLLSKARGDTIRLVPNCDAVCRKNSPLAAYYVSNPMTTMNQVNMPPIKNIKGNVMRGINPPLKNVIPVVQRPQVPVAMNVVRPVLPPPVQVKPRTLPKPIIQKQIVEKPVSVKSTEAPKVTSPTVKVIPPTQVVRVVPMQPKPFPVINVQPRYLVPAPVPVQRYSYMNTPSYLSPQNMGFVPQGYIHQPVMYPVKKPFVNPFGNFRLINKIGKKVDLIYRTLTWLKRRYFQARPPVPGTVLVTPMVPRVIPHPVIVPIKPIAPGKPLQPVRMVRRMELSTPISPEQKTSTVTKYVTQPPPPQIQKVPVSPKPVVATPKKVNICIVDEDCTKKNPGKPSKHGNPKESDSESESSSSNSSSDDEPVRDDPKPEKPPYLLKSNKPNRKEKTPSYDRDNEFTKCYLMAGSANCSKKDSINSHGDFLPRKPDIGNALTHDNAFDENDRVLYLSDLLRGW